MDGLRVSELAERAGVAPSTVRFYERAGLLSPARRAGNGYRVFDESALDELAFISRAKGIGMSLEDIAGLVASWPGECRSLQARLRAYLAPGQAPAGAAPWGCSLDSDALASRVAQWRALAAAATSGEPRPFSPIPPPLAPRPPVSPLGLSFPPPSPRLLLPFSPGTPAGKASAMKAGRTGTGTDADISLPAGIPRRPGSLARFHLVLERCHVGGHLLACFPADHQRHQDLADAAAGEVDADGQPDREPVTGSTRTSTAAQIGPSVPRTPQARGR